MTDTGPILVGYDGSDQSNAALDWAADEAGRTGQPVEIVYAFELPTLGSWIGPGTGPGIWPDEVVRREVEAMLREARNTTRERHPDVDVRAELVDGPAGLVLQQRSARAALVVLGTRGHGGFESLLLGSTAAAVSSHAHCPVVVIRGPVEPGRRPVVVGLDGSECSMLALGFAFARARSRRVALRALRVWAPPNRPWRRGEGPDEAAVRESEGAALDESLSGWRERYPEVEMSAEVLVASPAVALIEATRTAQLVVVGSRGRGGFRGLVLGSVSHQLVHHAEGPVAVVHQLPADEHRADKR